MLLTQSQSGGGGAGKKSDDTLLEIAKDILSKVSGNSVSGSLALGFVNLSTVVRSCFWQITMFNLAPFYLLKFPSLLLMYSLYFAFCLVYLNDFWMSQSLELF